MLDFGTDWHVSGVGDFNGDGYYDILLTKNDGTITNLLGQANGSFADNSTHFLTNVGTGWHVAGVGDFNGDGRSDILWRADDGTVTDWLGQADGNFVTNWANFAVNPGTEWSVAGVGDFNGDSRSDILWRKDNADYSVLLTDWLGQANGGFVDNAANFSIGVDYIWGLGGIGDFNGDGRSDILSTEFDFSSGAFHVSVLQANASGGFVTAFSTDELTVDWQVAAVGDFNGDGRSDVQWRGYGNDTMNQMKEWQGTSNGGFETIILPNLTTTLNAAGVGDFNGDGRDDILWRADDGSVEARYTDTGQVTTVLEKTPEQLWQEALANVRAFFDELTNQMELAGSSSGSDQSSYYDDYSDWAPMDDPFYLSMFGWMPSVQNDPSVHFFDYLSRDVDSEFDLATMGANGFSASFDGKVGSMGEVGGVQNTYIFQMNGVAMCGVWHDGAPPAGSSPNNIVIVGQAGNAASYFSFTSLIDFKPGLPNNTGGSAGSSDPIHTTAGGHTYHYSANLSAQQISLLDKIVDYGYAHGFQEWEIKIAVDQAFYESSLGQLTNNPTNSDVMGIYQYDSATWADLGHGNLNRASADDQISAFYSDITTFLVRFIDAGSHGLLPDGFGFEDYMEVKHHLGSNSTNWSSSVVTEYEQKSAQLGFGM